MPSLGRTPEGFGQKYLQMKAFFTAIFKAGKMGVGLSEYRAAIGGFASIAANAKPKSKIKSKQEKPTKPFDRGEEEHSEKDRKSYSAPSSVRRRPLSLNGSRRGSRSRAVGRGSQSLNQRSHADRISKYRSRSPREGMDEQTTLIPKAGKWEVNCNCRREFTSS